MSTTAAKKKILFFNVIPLPHSIDMHEQLVEDGYMVDFWYLKDLTGMYPWQVLEKKISYHIYKANLRQFFTVLGSANKSGLVIITGWHSLTHILLALYCKLCGIKFAFWLDVPDVPPPGFKKSLKQWLLNRASALFITGKNGINFFINCYKAKKEKCFDFPYLEVKTVREDMAAINEGRAIILMNGGKIKLLLSNRFLNRKGYSTVLAALKELPAAYLANLDITILGTGVEKEMYEKEFALLSKDIKLKGWVEYGDYLNILQNTDAYIHASTHEPYGIPPLDAMRYGKLVIGSKGVMSCLDRIENGVNGFLFDAGDHSMLASILMKIIDNKEWVYQKGKLALDTSMQYGYKYNLKAIEAVMNSK
jgi:glycosyltransferase involved in cell wall biosynthesis